MTVLQINADTPKGSPEYYTQAVVAVNGAAAQEPTEEMKRAAYKEEWDRTQVPQFKNQVIVGSGLKGKGRTYPAGLPSFGFVVKDKMVERRLGFGKRQAIRHD